MPIIRAADHVEVYRRRARSEPLATLSGRYETSTGFVAATALAALDLQPESRLLDIGCGDGTLLAMADPVPARRVGVVPTAEEAEALRAAHGASPEFRVARAEALPDDLGEFDRIVINGVLLLLPDLDACRAALDQIARVAAPGALVWTGEIMVADETAASGGRTHIGRLARLLGKGRLRTLARRLRRVWQGLVLGREVTLVPRSLLRIGEAEFAAMCRAAGFEVLDIRGHFEQTRQGRIRPVPSRRDFLLRRVGA